MFAHLLHREAVYTSLHKGRHALYYLVVCGDIRAIPNTICLCFGTNQQQIFEGSAVAAMGRGLIRTRGTFRPTKAIAAGLWECHLNGLFV